MQKTTVASVCGTLILAGLFNIYASWEGGFLHSSSMPPEQRVSGFSPGSSVISPRGSSTLDSLVGYLRENTGSVLICGYTETPCPDPGLQMKRAKEIGRYLENHGIPSRRFTPTGSSFFTKGAIDFRVVEDPGF
ncbi:MAG: OmpA family protein [Alphaproteobacteria bacterium]|nr:OmpA family protein [Alphaproteobacteria bacterium]